jgi:hypothetical protein
LSVERRFAMRRFVWGVPFALALMGLLFAGAVRGDTPPVVSFVTDHLTVAEDAGQVTLNVTLSATSDLTVTVTYATVEGSALAGKDFVPTSGTLTFTPGSTLQSFAVTLLDDALPEQDESFSVVLSAPQGATLGLYPELTVTITDDGDPYRVILPVVLKRWPPIPDVPVLNPISNADGDGSYTVSWSTAYLATTYVLEEDDNAAFSSPTQRYSGYSTSWSVTGKVPGTYYYRVKARNSWGDSGWSNIQSVGVVPPRAYVYVQNDTGSQLCYEVYNTGIGQRCFASGTAFYGSFPSGTYSWRASASCGSISGTRYYAPGTVVHRFYCSAVASLSTLQSR